MKTTLAHWMVLSSLLLLFALVVSRPVSPVKAQGSSTVTYNVHPLFQFYTGSNGYQLDAGAHQYSDLGGNCSGTAIGGNGCYSWVLMPTTYGNFTMYISTAQPSTGSLDCSVTHDLNGTPTGISISFPAGSAAGTVEADTTHTYSAAGGPTGSGGAMSLYCKNNATSRSAAINVSSLTATVAVN